MFILSGSVLENSELDINDNSKELTVTSCGHYVLLELENYVTNRPKGRKDYQLLYLKDGSVDFIINDTEYSIKKGQIVIYKPNQPQWYKSQLLNSPDIYWIHFYGNNINGFFESINNDDDLVFNVGFRKIYAQMFEQIIRELQLKRPYYETIINSLFSELLCRFSRSLDFNYFDKSFPIHPAVEKAIHTMNTAFADDFNVANWANQHNISACWFSRLFKRHTGNTPQAYLINLRINKAKELLISNNTVGEIGNIIGYQDPLYFSRIFKKHTGKSPTMYRKMIMQEIN